MIKRTWTKKIRPIRVDGDVAMIPLSNGSTAVIDAADLHLVEGWNWAGERAKSGGTYAYHGAGKTRVRLQNAIMPSPAGYLTDHIDGDPLNNRRANLRCATSAQNCQNRRLGRANKSGFKGVSWRADRRRWLASIRVNGRLYKLGTFESAELAARAYDAAAREHFGDFAVLNFSGWPA